MKMDVGQLDSAIEIFYLYYHGANVLLETTVLLIY